jgi:nucleosome binding factor SPN SPT16 subunit
MFLASKKKIEFLKPLEANLDTSSTVPNVKLLVREKDDQDKKNFSKLMDAVRASKKGKTIGTFAKDKFPGSFMELWRDALKKASFESVDVSNILGVIMAPKEESEISIVKKAAGLSSDIFSKYLKVGIVQMDDIFSLQCC